MHDTAPPEVLDCFLHRLQPSVHIQVLVTNPSICVHAALLAGRVAGAHGKAACSGPKPMDLGVMLLGYVQIDLKICFPMI